MKTTTDASACRLDHYIVHTRLCSYHSCACVKIVSSVFLVVYTHACMHLMFAFAGKTRTWYCNRAHLKLTYCWLGWVSVLVPRWYHTVGVGRSLQSYVFFQFIYAFIRQVNPQMVKASWMWCLLALASYYIYTQTTFRNFDRVSTISFSWTAQVTKVLSISWQYIDTDSLI